MTDRAGIRELVAGWGMPLDAAAIDGLERYAGLLRRWARRLNLTASPDWARIGPLLHEAVWAAASCKVRPRAHLDIGTGAGFPAIPIQLVCPAGQLDLVEPRWKRAVFLEAVASELGLTEVRVHAARLADLLVVRSPRWDRVSWKGIRVASDDLEVLAQCLLPRAEIWVFHGVELPVEDAAWFESRFPLQRRSRVPGRDRSWLSVFSPVSRETARPRRVSPPAAPRS